MIARPIHARLPIHAALLGAALLVVPAEGRAAEPPLDLIKTDIKVIESHIKNASMRLKYVAGGEMRKPGSLQRRGEKLPPPPVRNCCKNNVESIDSRLGSIERTMKDLSARAERAGDAQALDAVSHMAEVHGWMKKSLSQFATAFDAAYAHVLLKDLRAAATHFREATQKYVECCADAVAPAADEDPADKAKSKKKKKKSKKAEPDDDGSAR